MICVGDIAIANEDLPPGTTGKAEFRGAQWTAKNGTAGVLTQGQRCRIAKVEHLTLWLTPEAGEKAGLK